MTIAHYFLITTFVYFLHMHLWPFASRTFPVSLPSIFGGKPSSSGPLSHPCTCWWASECAFGYSWHHARKTAAHYFSRCQAGLWLVGSRCLGTYTKTNYRYDRVLPHSKWQSISLIFQAQICHKNMVTFVQIRWLIAYDAFVKHFLVVSEERLKIKNKFY